MRYTDEQIKAKAFELERAGAGPEVIRQFVSTAKKEQGGITTGEVATVVKPKGNALKRAASFVAKDVLAGGVKDDTNIAGEIFRSTLGSRGLAGVAQLPGKIVGQSGLLKDQTALSESNAGLADQTRKLIALTKNTTDIAKKDRLSKMIDSNLETLKTSRGTLEQSGKEVVAPKDTLSTGINAALSASLLPTSAVARPAGAIGNTLYGTGALKQVGVDLLRKTPVGVAQQFPKAYQTAEKLITGGRAVLPRAIEQAGIGLGYNAAENIRTEQPLGQNAGLAAGLSAAIPFAGTGAAAVKKALPKAEVKVAERVVNSLIKPLLKNLSYGKNPGKRVATEGLVFNSLDEGIDVVGARLGEIGQQMDETIKKYEGQGVYDANKFFEPIEQAISKLQDKPRTNAEAITRLRNALADIKGEVVDEMGRVNYVRNFDELTVRDLVTLKREVADMAKYTGNQSDDTIYNKAIQDTARNVKNFVNDVAPEMKTLNERWADLQSARTALIYRDKIAQRANLTSFSTKTIGSLVTGAGVLTVNPLLFAAGITEIGLDNLLGSAAFKTRFAKWLAKAPNTQKQEVLRNLPVLKPVFDRVFGDETLDEKTILKELDDYSSKNISNTKKYTGSANMAKTQSNVIPNDIPQTTKPVNPMDDLDSISFAGGAGMSASDLLGVTPKQYGQLSRELLGWDGTNAEESYKLFKKHYSSFKEKPEDATQFIKRTPSLRNANLFDDANDKFPNSSNDEIYDKFVERYRAEQIVKSKMNSAGAFAGFEQDEDGNIKFNPQKAVLGVVGLSAVKKVPPKVNGVLSKVQAKSVNIAGKTDDTLLKEVRKYKTTINIQDKNDLEELSRILSSDAIENIKSGKMTNWRGTSYEDLAQVNLISETPKTIAQQLEGKIKDIKLKSNTFYHGTSSESARAIMQTGFKRGSDLPENAFRGGGYGRVQNSISLAETPKEASIFSKLTRDGEIVEVQLKDSARVVSIQGIEDATDIEDYISYLRKQKIDAVYVGGGEKELVVINPKAIKPTKSQLIDIYNQAQKK